jgi:Asp-tRNA(Asn)/Glu-tRNA(Gln) amidotransferase A subunit family amidase
LGKIRCSTYSQPIPKQCSKSVYPFHDGEYEDFEPIFKLLIQLDINDPFEPEYTALFKHVAEDLEKQGDEVLESGNKSLASAFYLRACAVYRIGRFPYITKFPRENDEPKLEAWEAQKRVYLKAGALWEEPVQEVIVEHAHRKGRDLDVIPVYVRVPKGKDSAPVVILMTGLDGYRPDNTVRCDEFLKRGW